MNIEEVSRTQTTWPEAGVPRVADDDRRSDPDMSDEAPFPPFLIPPAVEPVWPRVFPGL
jgi:hypothetical protein